MAIGRISHALKWLVAFIRGQRGTTIRTYLLDTLDSPHTVQLLCDASPWGIGAVLVLDGRATAWLADTVQPGDVEQLHIKAGDHRFQAILELLAIAVALRTWLPVWRQRRVLLVTRSDSMAALGALQAVRSTSAAMNVVVREIALDMAEGWYTIDVIKHIAGVDNGWADALSRLSATEGSKSVPAELTAVPRHTCSLRSGAWWRACADPFAAVSG